MFLYVAVPAVLAAAFAGWVASRPAQFRIERRRVVPAPAAVLHGLVNDFHEWAAWSPWEKLDPAMTKEFSGADNGVGAAYAWKGNNKAGEGRMTITGSDAPRSVEIRLEFLKPWTATNTTRFEFVPGGSDTEVVWSMTGTNNFMAKAFSVVMNMDKLVGKDFETGLASLETVARERTTTAS